MIYDDFEFNYEKNVLNKDSPSLRTFLSYNHQDIQDDLQNLIFVTSPTNHDFFIESFSRIISILKDLEQYYGDIIYIRDIKDKEFFNIIEIIYNFLIPLNIKYLMIDIKGNNMVEEDLVSLKTKNIPFLSESISSSIVVAESQITYCYGLLIRGVSKESSLKTHNFYPYELQNYQEIINKEEPMVETNIIKKLYKKKSKKLNKNVPEGPENLIIKPLEES